MTEWNFDVAIIGGGPAGLAAGLNLARANRQVIILDSNRPRHAATLRSHGFITRDGAPPLELRRLGREEFEAYENATFAQATVTAVTPLSGDEDVDNTAGFRVVAEGVRGAPDQDITVRFVLVAAGLVEELPALPSLRAYYGTALHSCVECDAYEKTGWPLAVIGETTDVFDRALQLTPFTQDLTLFTNGADTVTPEEEQLLEVSGVTLERRPIEDIEGEKGEMTGVRLTDGTVIECRGGFVRPRWNASTDYLGDLVPRRNRWGLLEVRANGETSIPGIYAAGDITPPGPEQLLIAAGEGARVSNRINVSLIRADLGLSIAASMG
ncbi:FAD-dependent oxidoreductase [Klugiella xanthotipulae]|uniref:Thioredoxin reductase n=1 Tax=Klugiella xanthotipulae TaxID=244735 RepID=A0A543I442_9MICO|nr:NAD(P)/FAD-dependent oxidoreductase [Klugiella xanthotipulae]TQM65345.1 thioredoxin reductase [Klugiella xanthotipulae]